MIIWNSRTTDLRDEAQSKRDAWGEGPWQQEQDKYQGIDTDTDYDVLIVRNNFGALCGYVGVPETHPWFGTHYNSSDAIDVQVHGGLTFAARCQEDEEFGVCHVPRPGYADKVWWFGFDCAHGGDICPGIDAALRMSGAEYLVKEKRSWETYQAVPYVEQEIAALAQQLKAAEVPHG